MFNRSKQLIAVGLSMAVAALGNAGFKAERFETHAERRMRRGKPITTRFFWGGSRKFCPPGGGAQEVERRRRQIEAGTLLTTAEHEALRAWRQGRPVVTSVDMGSPDGDVTVHAAIRPDGTIEVLKHTTQGKSEAGSIVVYQGAAELDPHHQ